MVGIFCVRFMEQLLLIEFRAIPCRFCKESIGDVYGKRSEEMIRYKEALKQLDMH